MLNNLEEGMSSRIPADRRPCFYKIIWKNVLQTTTDFRIPPDFFRHHLQSEATDERVTLKGPLGSWDVMLEQRDDGVFIAQGWPDFVKSHCLGDKEIALFLYNGGISFDVNIFEKSGSLKTYQTSSQQSTTTSPFTSSFPFFQHKMKGYNVGHKCILVIPKSFSDKHHIPMSKHEILLRDSDGVSWSARIIVMTSGRLALSGGWKTFSDAHSIKEGDDCIFELVEQGLMQVHMIRR